MKQYHILILGLTLVSLSSFAGRPSSGGASGGVSNVNQGDGTVPNTANGANDADNNANPSAPPNTSNAQGAMGVGAVVVGGLAGGAIGGLVGTVSGKKSLESKVEKHKAIVQQLTKTETDIRQKQGTINEDARKLKEEWADERVAKEDENKVTKPNHDESIEVAAYASDEGGKKAQLQKRMKQDLEKKIEFQEREKTSMEKELTQLQGKSKEGTGGHLLQDQQQKMEMYSQDIQKLNETISTMQVAHKKLTDGDLPLKELHNIGKDHRLLNSEEDKIIERAHGYIEKIHQAHFPNLAMKT
jgi:hypothetical protein